MRRAAYLHPAFSELARQLDLTGFLILCPTPPMGGVFFPISLRIPRPIGFLFILFFYFRPNRAVLKNPSRRRRRKQEVIASLAAVNEIDVDAAAVADFIGIYTDKIGILINDVLHYIISYSIHYII